MVMTRRRLLNSIDQERIKKAIENAERLTSGEIRVSVAPLFWGDVQKAAERTFVRMGMKETKDRNSILFFLVPARRKFVVLGDAGIHERVGQHFWDSIASALSEKFRQSDFTGGLVSAIEEVGRQLGAHFPYHATDKNELSNEVDFGP